MPLPSSRACRRPIAMAVVAALASLGTVVLMPHVASASGTDTWTGAAGDGNWGTAGNWAAHTVPASGDNVVFPAGAPSTVTLNVIATVTNITLDGDYLFPVGAPLNIVGNATISQPVSGTNSYFENPINFAGATSVTTATTFSSEVAFSQITGTTGVFNITGTNGGTILTYPPTYTASAINVVSGILEDTGEGGYGNGPITVANGAVLDNNYWRITNNLTISGSQAVQLGGQPVLLTGTVTLAGNATVGPEPTFQNVVNVGPYTLTITNPYGVGVPTFSAPVVGTGAVDLNGPETFLFSANGNTVPNIVLTSGTRQIIDVTGSMPSTIISAPSGGMIEGTSIIGGVAAGGTILGGSTVNNNAAGGILTIASQPTLGPAFGLQVEDASYSNYGSVAVLGPVDLNGATLLQPVDGPSSLGNVYTILTSTGALTGTFAGDPNGTIIQDNNGADFVINYLSNSVTLTDVGPVPTSFTASATPSTVPYGSTSMLAETGLPGGASGTVTFASGGATLCAVTLPTTSCATSAGLSAGTYPITATYSGGGLNAGSTATTSLTVSPLPTSFTAAATPSSISFGSTSSLSESGLPGAATGTVTFTSGGSTLCAAMLPVTSCATSSTLGAGTYPVVATYSGDTDNAGSTASTSLTVTRTATSFTASATPSSVSFGTSSALAAAGLPGDATGSVTFASGGQTLCTALLPATTCPTATTLSAGTYPITATYSGDANYVGATSTTSLIITVDTTSFTASATPASVAYGTASVLAESGVPAGATGTVAFVSGGATLCTVLLPATTCSTATTLAAATYPITATYSGDADYAGSTATTSLTVTRLATSFTASATPANVTYGATSALAEAGLPGGATGTVVFASGGATLCTVILPATSCSTAPSLGAGTYPITATYAGDGNDAGSTAATSLTISVASTPFTSSASPPSVAFGTGSSLAAVGLPGAATGTVTFVAGGATLCVATLPATACTTAASLAPGVYAITATYSGDADYASSTASTALTVTLAATSITVTSSRNPAAPGQAVVYTARVTANPGSGTVSFTANGVAIAGCTGVAVNPLTGEATCSTEYAAAGAHVIGATFSGNADYAASSAATSGVLALTETVDAAVTVPSTGSASATTPAQELFGGLLALLGGLTIWGARRRRSHL